MSKFRGFFSGHDGSDRSKFFKRFAPFMAAGVLLVTLAFGVKHFFKEKSVTSSSLASESGRFPANTVPVLDPQVLAPSSVSALNALNAALVANFNSRPSLQNNSPANAGVTELQMFDRRREAFERLVVENQSVRALWQNFENALRAEVSNIGLSVVEFGPKGISVGKAPNASPTNLFANAIGDLLDSTPNGFTTAQLHLDPVCDGFCGFASGHREANFNMDEILLSRDLNQSRTTGLVLHERVHVIDAYMESRGEHSMGVSTIVSPHDAPGGYTRGFVLGELRAFAEDQRVAYATLSRQSPVYEFSREQTNFVAMTRFASATNEMVRGVRNAIDSGTISTRDVSVNASGPGVMLRVEYPNSGGTTSTVFIRLPHMARGALMSEIKDQVRNVWLPEVESVVLAVLNQARQGTDKLFQNGILNQSALDERRDSLQRVISDSRGRLMDTGPVVVSPESNVNRLAAEAASIMPMRADVVPTEAPAIQVETRPVPPQTLGQALARDIGANFNTPTAAGLTTADVLISSLDAISKHGPAFTVAARANDVAAMNAIIQQVNRDKNISAAATILFVPAVRAGAFGTISVAIRLGTTVGALPAAEAAALARLAPRMTNIVTAGVVLVLTLPAMYDFFTDAAVREKFYTQVRWMRDNPRTTLRIGLEALQADFRTGCAQIPACSNFNLTFMITNHIVGNLFRDSVTQQPTYGNNSGSSVIGAGGQTTFFVSPTAQGAQVPIPSPNWRWQTQQASTSEGSVVIFNRTLVDSHTNLPPDVYQSVLNAGRMPAYLSEYNRRIDISLANPESPNFSYREVLASIGHPVPGSSNFADRTSSAVGPGYSVLETASPSGGTNKWSEFSLTPPYLYAVDPSFSFGDMSSFVSPFPQVYFGMNPALGGATSGGIFGGIGSWFSGWFSGGSSSGSSGASTGGTTSGFTDNISPLGVSPEQSAFIEPSFSPTLSAGSRVIVVTGAQAPPKLFTQDGREAPPNVQNLNNPPPLYTEREIFLLQEQTRIALEALASRRPVVDPDKQRWARERENLSYLVRYRPALQLISPALPGPIAGSGNTPPGVTPPINPGAPGGQPPAPPQPDPSVHVSPFGQVKCKLGDQEVPVSGTIRAYRSRVLFDPCGLCDEELEIRVCQSDGTLTGTAEYLSCSAATNYSRIRQMCR